MIPTVRIDQPVMAACPCRTWALVSSHPESNGFHQRRNRWMPGPGSVHRLSATTEPVCAENASGTLTERIFKSLEETNMDSQGSALGAGGLTRLSDLRRIDSAWKSLRARQIYGLPPLFVRRTEERLPATPGLDVIVAGGTLGIFLAASLQQAGLRVAVIEKGKLLGREQEWNISRKEVYELVRCGVLTQQEVEDSIAVEFNPVRVAFDSSPKEIWARDALNLGVSPSLLIAAAKKRFEQAGGLVLETVSVDNVWVHPDGVEVCCKEQQTNKRIAVASKVYVDCTGNQSQLVRQLRHGDKPDGVCLVVGTCARGFPSDKNRSGDLIVTTGPSQEHNTFSVSNLQLFWEAFPAGSGPEDRTTYMFTYLDAHPDRPSLEELMELYWQKMPEYQGIELEKLKILRILFGLFPTYRNSPLHIPFDRIVAVGDASGMQSPLSFGGFAALMRSLTRMTGAISDAIATNCVDAHHLSYINGYNPSLRGAWMLQKAMSISADATAYDVRFINRLLGGNFAAMESLGDKTLLPFLQDVVQVRPLAHTLLKQMSSDPLFIPQIIARVGVGPLLDWVQHFLAMALYTALYSLAEQISLEKKVSDTKIFSPTQRYMLRRAIERWQYGSGLDYKHDA